MRSSTAGSRILTFVVTLVVLWVALDWIFEVPKAFPISLLVALATAVFVPFMPDLFGRPARRS